MTSHDVVAKVRRATGIKKVGHAGTLDPLATGVLVLCLGKATRLSEFIMAHTKVYAAEIRLGIITDTYDAEGEVVHADSTPVSAEQVSAILPEFTGEIEQIPPMYSAIKRAGKKLYELAREGKTVERPARRVDITALYLTNWDFPRFSLQVTCSPGTYIRSLAHDIGERLGVGAHLAALRRVSSGDAFRVENAVAFDTLLAAIQRDDWQQFLIGADVALADIPRIELDSEQSQQVQRGGFLRLNCHEPGPIRVHDPGGNLVALMSRRSADDGEPPLWKPMKVFA
ncbi:MAG: tRNA pseudouridine(55) synthase TruB [Chloroflexi bacterium]|nr:tRNA pseudouridine(55) synthase TruB [Chloroflexota bacterium]